MSEAARRRICWRCSAVLMGAPIRRLDKVAAPKERQPFSHSWGGCKATSLGHAEQPRGRKLQQVVQRQRRKDARWIGAEVAAVDVDGTICHGGAAHRARCRGVVGVDWSTWWTRFVKLGIAAWFRDFDQETTRFSDCRPSLLTWLTWTSRRTRAVRAYLAQDWLHEFQDRINIVFASLGILLDQFQNLGTVLVLASKLRDD